jgi:flagellar hook capping protein FlgD
MLRTRISLVIAGLTLGAALAFADPDFILRYPSGVPQVSITGDYTGSHYTVWRQPAAGGEPVAIGERSILCLGSCYAEDRGAVPGTSYLYLFEVMDERAGIITRFGPFAATISPALARRVGVYVYPNPGHGATGIQLHVAGAVGDRPLAAEAAIYDLGGRRVRTVHRGPIARGMTTVSWDGRGEAGERVPAGVYVLRFSAGGGSTVARIIRL